MPVHQSKYDEFLEAGAAAFDQMVVGDLWDPATNIGLMIRPDHKARVLGFVEDSRPPPAGRSPEVSLAGAGEGLVRQPGAARQPPRPTPAPYSRRSSLGRRILLFKDTDDAIRLANDTAYGLPRIRRCNDLW